MSAASSGQNREIAVFIEAGKRRVFASALDWPGWARRGKTEDEALASLADYYERYAPIVARAQLAAPSGALVISERHDGLARNVDFGALGEMAPSETEPLAAADGARLATLLAAAWAAFDEAAAAAPAVLRKGPRGGGRDTAQIVDHVVGAESMYARKMGLEKARPGDDQAAAIRQATLAALRDPAGLVTPPRGWPPRTAARRLAWHVLDHLWEIEDKS
jgi:hypothetical protein